MGNLYIADKLNDRIRYIDNNGIIRLFAGSGFPGSEGDGSQAIYAQLSGPCDVTFDNDDNCYIVDTYNCRIRKVWKKILLSEPNEFYFSVSKKRRLKILLYNLHFIFTSAPSRRRP
jgi:hypothetical protein